MIVALKKGQMGHLAFVTWANIYPLDFINYNDNNKKMV